MNDASSLLISFSPTPTGFRGYVSITDLVARELDLQPLLQLAEHIYQSSVVDLRLQIKKINQLKTHKVAVPSRLMWRFGDSIFRLVNELDLHGLGVDGLYGHLVRDLKLKTKWLEKAVTFRRYLDDETRIPEGLNWNVCRDAPKRSAIRLGKVVR